LQLALNYVREHYTESLGVEKVARIAGFTPNYFSKLFSLREKMTFLDYLLSLRIERAKQLLSSTDLDATRVAELSGFNSPQYFSRMFHRATGMTPLGYRKNPGKSPKGRENGQKTRSSSGKKRTKRN
jgi:two-component system response regulator YesN